MSGHKDIYKAPDKLPEEDKNYMVDLTMAEARRRTIRAVVVFFICAVALLLGVVWLLDDGEEEEMIDYGGELFEGVIGQPREPREVPLPDEFRALGMAEATPVPAMTILSPQQLAEATGEMRLAQRYFEQRKWDEAEKHVRQALAIHPKMNAALRMMGVIFNHRGQFDQAIQVFEEALAQEPFSAETMNNMATAYMQRGMMDKAEELLQTAFRMRPDYVVTPLNLGLLYLAKGEYQLTVEYLDMAIPKVPRDTSVRNNLGVALLRLGRYDEARHHFRIILEQHPRNIPAHFNTAITHVLEGNHDEAIVWIEDGAEVSSPVMLKRFLDDQDFNSVREHPGFQRIMHALAPRLPSGPGSADVMAPPP